MLHFVKAKLDEVTDGKNERKLYACSWLSLCGSGLGKLSLVFFASQENVRVHAMHTDGGFSQRRCEFGADCMWMGFCPGQILV